MNDLRVRQMCRTTSERFIFGTEKEGGWGAFIGKSAGYGETPEEAMEMLWSDFLTRYGHLIEKGEPDAAEGT